MSIYTSVDNRETYQFNPVKKKGGGVGSAYIHGSFELQLHGNKARKVSVVQNNL